MEQVKVNLKINGKEITVAKGTKLLAAARRVGIIIPTLCYHPDIKPTAACGICVVKMNNMGGKYLRACVTEVQEGMDVITHDAEINKVRRGILDLILSAHPNDCLNCFRNGECELQTLAANFGIDEVRFDKLKQTEPIDDSTGAVVFNPEKCIKCGRCLYACQELQNVHAITCINRGFNTVYLPSADELSQSPCVDCGQCITHCPVGAIYEHDDTQKVIDALGDSDKYVTVQMAPSVRVAVGETLGFEIGENITAQIYSAMKIIGFDAIFDTNFGADMTIMEEASEFLDRFVNKKGVLPMTTSCCPAWVKYIQEYYPDMLDHVSTAKSPHMMLAPMAKTYYAKKMKIDPSKIFNVSIMPCTAKKNEITRNDTMNSSGYQDVDVVITTREFARLIKRLGIDMLNIKAESCDSILGEYSGAGTIFGVTGGVMEAALRTAVNSITGKNPEKLEFTDVRGLDGVKQCSLDVAGNEVRVAVVNGLKNAEPVLEKVKEAKANGSEVPYHFIEVMACFGGCVAGGGQPYGTTNATRVKRARGLYSEDDAIELRCSHDNPEIKKLYEDFLGEPLGEKSHHYLHTHYEATPKYKK